ncbi:MAG: hypothetical protein RLZZ301_1269 [Bacteroidota bacterium]|jgi:phage shock protein PspC (stress-responsive transcriptional regulator)
MNKTISIHLQGFPFILEEQAYTVLENYLNELRQVLQYEEGVDEIIQDIELRIVELLQETQKGGQVIQLERIQFIMSVLGDASNFGESVLESEAEKTTHPETATTKRFFRDRENAVLGGVASGVSAYFDVDVVIVRALFVLCFMAFGSGIPVYILFWIITPAAKTASEKLQMRGKAVNVEGIKTEVKEAADRVQQNSKKWAKHVRSELNNKEGLQRFIHAFRRFLGIAMLFFGITLTLVLCFFLFIDPNWVPAQINGQFTSLGMLFSIFFEDDGTHQLLIYGIAILGFAWAFSSILAALRLLFSFQSLWIKWSLSLLGFSVAIGIVMLSYAGVKTARSYAYEGELSQEVARIQQEELQLQTVSLHANKSYDGFTAKETHFERLIVRNGRIYNHGIEIVCEASSDSLFHIVLIKKANGYGVEKANQRASHIQYPLKWSHKHLELPTYLSYPLADKMRDQEVVIKIRVPEGKNVRLNQAQIFPRVSEVLNLEQEEAHGFIDSDGSYSCWD